MALRVFFARVESWWVVRWLVRTGQDAAPWQHVSLMFAWLKFAALDTFQYMVKRRASMADLCVWLRGLVESLLLPKMETVGFRTASRRFLMVWSTVCTNIMQKLRQKGPSNASSKLFVCFGLFFLLLFLQTNWSGWAGCHHHHNLLDGIRTLPPSPPGSLHLMHLLFNEYVLNEVERLAFEESMRELMVNMANAHTSPDLFNATFVDTLGQDFLTSQTVLHWDNNNSQCQQHQVVAPTPTPTPLPAPTAETPAAATPLLGPFAPPERGFSSRADDDQGRTNKTLTTANNQRPSSILDQPPGDPKRIKTETVSKVSSTTKRWSPTIANPAVQGR